jgi:hypothetical protein
MERIGTVLFAAFALFDAMPAHAEVFQAFHSGMNYYLYEDSSVAPGALVEFGDLFIESSLFLENRGEISSRIFIAGGTQLYFQNSGVFSGEICFGENSLLVQVVRSSADLNRPNAANSGSWTVLVQSGEALSLSDIRRSALRADKIILDGATITLGAAEAPGGGPALRMRALPTPIELSGEVLIDLRGAEIKNGMTLLSDVSGDGSVSVLAPNVGRLYYARARRSGNNILLDIARETDYEKIFGQGSPNGAFINRMRAAGTNQALVRTLDSQTTFEGLFDVMNGSIAFNPVRLMRPVRIFNFSESMPAFGRGRSTGAGPVYIFGSDMEIYGANAHASAAAGDFVFSASGHAGALSASSGSDDFSGDFYGGNLSAFWAGESLRIGADAGLDRARFQAGAVHDGRGGAVFDPKGRAVYGNLDAGAELGLGGGFHVSPFAGAGARRESVLHQSDSEIYMKAGAYTGFSETTGGLRYDYDVFAVARTDGMLSVGAKAGAWSSADEAGAEISYSMIRDEIGVAHKVSVGGKFSF